MPAAQSQLLMLSYYDGVCMLEVPMDSDPQSQRCEIIPHFICRYTLIASDRGDVDEVENPL